MPLLRLGAILALLVSLPLSLHAGNRKNADRPGFLKFARVYTGGYNVTSATGVSSAGPGTVRIHAAKNGSSASMVWVNTFYNEKGAYRVRMKWKFLAGGTLQANSVDPRLSSDPATGTQSLKNRRARYIATTSTGGTVTGQVRLIGGATLWIDGTITGLPEGDVTFSFSGSKKR